MSAPQSYILPTLPTLVALALVTVVTVNFPWPGVPFFPPLFLAMTVFYWAAYWPKLMPPWLVFLLGLFQDMLYGTLPGMTSCLLLLLWWGTASQRRYVVREPFPVVWLIFTVILALYTSLTWVIHLIYFRYSGWSETLYVQYLLTVAFYPCLHALFNAIHRRVVDPYA